MTTKTQILTWFETNRGEIISGEVLAERFGVSRTAVWKAIKDLQKAGHAIEAVPQKGYTMHSDNEVLSEEGIRPYLTQEVPMLVVESEIDSTNLLAKQLAAQGAGHGTLVIADAQKQGRGRRGRNFSSPPGTGLYLTMILRNHLPMDSAVMVTSAAAVAVCRAIETVCGKQLSIKWVNDLFYQEKKCCGILTEASADMESGGVDYLVVGIGLNLVTPQEGFPPELQEIATAIFEQGEPVRRCRIAAAIANELLQLANALPDTSFMQDYRARNFTTGRDITILQNGMTRPAHALAILDSGHLLVQTQQGEEELSFGEISIRL